VIPTHNGGRRVVDVLRGIAAQGGAPGTAEVIVIDNASTDDTSAFLAADPVFAALAACGIPARVVREPQPGLTPARFRGLREAASEIVCFLDDDTVPESGYLTAGLDAIADPAVGMLTSRVFPDYEVAPSPAIARREMMLALNYRLGDEPRDWSTVPAVAPTLGAGMWVRRRALASVLADGARPPLLTDRVGASLVSGGDIELGAMVAAAGYVRRYAPAARLRHNIPAARVSMPYFRRLVHGVVRSHLTVTHRYPPRSWTAGERARAIARLAAAVLAFPVLLLRRDGWREAVLVLTARWAEVQGPFPSSPAGR
jgi:glycosyltransferase involved in cell wall biosynthesis